MGNKIYIAIELFSRFTYIKLFALHKFIAITDEAQ